MSVLAPLSSLHAQAGQSQAGKKGATVFLDGDHSARPAAHRTIVGHVTGEDGKPAAGALVYLKEADSSNVRTMIADENGNYEFGPLPLTVDYQLWAQDGNQKTAIKPISSFIETNYLSIPLRFEATSKATAASAAATH